VSTQFQIKKTVFSTFLKKVRKEWFSENWSLARWLRQRMKLEKELV
jgi:hypothetical protein